MRMEMTGTLSIEYIRDLFHSVPQALFQFKIQWKSAGSADMIWFSPAEISFDEMRSAEVSWYWSLIIDKVQQQKNT